LEQSSAWFNSVNFQGVTASRRACCGRVGCRPDGARDPSVMGTPGHRQHAGSGRKKVKEGGNDLASRVEWRASSVMGRNKFGWRLNMKTC
jgi:hypothetical protein